MNNKTSKKRGRPRKDDIVRNNSVQEGLTADYTRATFILEVSLLEKLKHYAYIERLTIKDAINGLLKKGLEGTKGGWIPVSKEPVKFPCLAVSNFGQVFIPSNVTTFELNGEKKYVEWVRDTAWKTAYIEIVAWQPLPEYEED